MKLRQHGVQWQGLEVAILAFAAFLGSFLFLRFNLDIPRSMNSSGAGEALVESKNGVHVMRTSEIDMPTFIDVAPDVGLDQVTSKRLSYGPNLGDYNGDGRLDLLLNNHGDPVALYQQSIQGRYTDVVELAGIEVEGDMHGAAWGDCDNDGYLDLYQTLGAFHGARKKTNRLYHNEKDGTFTEVTADAKVTDPRGRGRSASWVDYDRDGNLDLFITNITGVDSKDQLYTNLGDCRFDNDSADVGDLASGFGMGVAWADYDKDGNMDAFHYQYNTSLRIFNNNADGTFSNLMYMAGIIHERICNAVWGDFDNDADPDLFMTKCYPSMVDGLRLSDNRIETFGTRNSEDDEQDGIDFSTDAETIHFRVIFPTVSRCSKDQKALVHIGRKGISPHAKYREFCAYSITNGRGGYGAPDYQIGQDHGLYIWQSGPGDWHLRWIVPPDGRQSQYIAVIEADQPITDAVLIEPEIPQRDFTNRLYRNNGDNTFEDVAGNAGVHHNLNSQDAMWADFNNDGFLDLYVVNAGDTQIGNQPNFLYMNQGDGTFMEVGSQVGASGTEEGLGANGAIGDFNADGFPDIFIQNGHHFSTSFNGPHQLLLNSGNQAHWLQIQLEGNESNRLGIGARVRVEMEDGFSQVREMNGGIHGTSQDEMLLTFGLGQRENISQVTVRWPSGIVQHLTEVTAEQRLVIIEPPRFGLLGRLSVQHFALGGLLVLGIVIIFLLLQRGGARSKSLQED
jgi:hypothetical protein